MTRCRGGPASQTMTLQLTAGHWTHWTPSHTLLFFKTRIFSLLPLAISGELAQPLSQIFGQLTAALYLLYYANPIQSIKDYIGKIGIFLFSCRKDWYHFHAYMVNIWLCPQENPQSDSLGVPGEKVSHITACKIPKSCFTLLYRLKKKMMTRHIHQWASLEMSILSPRFPLFLVFMSCQVKLS